MNDIQKKVLVIAGPTGSGESTITNAIIQRYPNFARLVTATTRAPRKGEEHKVSYYFLSRDEFIAAIKDGNILEHTHVSSRDVYYGTYKPDLDGKFAKGKVVIINPDVVGAKFYKEHYNATTIFVVPGSMDELRGRIQKRDSNITEEEVAKRMRQAEEEVTNEREFYDYEIVNADGKLDEAIAEVVDILKKEQYL